MKNIKTKETKKNIKTLDKSRVLADRMKNAATQTKEKAEQGVSANENSPNEYAADRTEQTVGRIKDKAIYEFNKQGQKGLEETKQNISKARNFIRNRRNDGSSYSETSNGSGVKSTKNPVSKQIKTLDRGEKTIKQSNRSAGKTTVKAAEKQTIKTTQKSVKTAEKSSKVAVKTAQQSAKAARKTAQATVKASQKAAQVTRAVAKAAVTTLKEAAKATVAAVKTIIAGTKALIAAIAAGGWIAVVVIVVICFFALIFGSCFGIFFSNEKTPGGTPIQQVVSQLNTEYYDKIEQIKSVNDYDDVEIVSSDDVQAIKWNEVLAVFAVKTTIGTNACDVVTITDDKIEILRQVLWDMNIITHSYRTVSKDVDVVETDADGKETTVKKTVSEKILTIYLTHKSCSEMITKYSFNAEQTEQLNLMLSDEYDSLWAELLGGYSAGIGEIIVSGADWKPIDIFAWALPESYEISSQFGYRSDPFTGKTKFHGGLDIAAPVGTPVLAAADGIITVANSTDNWGYGYGYYVKIKHNDIYETLYAHCSSIAVVYGQEVKKGQVIAYVGTTGNSTGRHLHFEIYKNGERTNPMSYFE